VGVKRWSININRIVLQCNQLNRTETLLMFSRLSLSCVSLCCNR